MPRAGGMERPPSKREPRTDWLCPRANEGVSWGFWGDSRCFRARRSVSSLLRLKGRGINQTLDRALVEPGLKKMHCPGSVQERAKTNGRTRGLGMEEPKPPGRQHYNKARAKIRDDKDIKCRMKSSGISSKKVSIAEGKKEREEAICENLTLRPWTKTLLAPVKREGKGGD